MDLTLKNFKKQINYLYELYSEIHSFDDLTKLNLSYIKILKEKEKEVRREIAIQKNIEKLNKREQKKICAQCDEVFFYGRSNARFCSIICAHRNWIKRDRLIKQNKTH